MAHKQPCAKYEYVVTPAGPKILPVPEAHSKDEESPADYNAGGYLQVKVKDSFKDGRYTVLRKLGCVLLAASDHRRICTRDVSELSIPCTHRRHTTSWGHFSTVWLVKDHQ